MAVAFIQEFAIADRSTANYDHIREQLGDAPIDGLVAHTAGFDDASGVFRIFDVWDTREQAERFLERAMEMVGSDLPPDVAPPLRQSFYELHDVAVSG